MRIRQPARNFDADGMKGPSGKVLESGIYRAAAPASTFRCGYGDDDLLRSQRTAENGKARNIAEQWRQAVLAKRR